MVVQTSLLHNAAKWPMLRIPRFTESSSAWLMLIRSIKQVVVLGALTCGLKHSPTTCASRLKPKIHNPALGPSCHSCPSKGTSDLVTGKIWNAPRMTETKVVINHSRKDMHQPRLVSKYQNLLREGARHVCEINISIRSMGCDCCHSLKRSSSRHSFVRRFPQKKKNSNCLIDFVFNVYIMVLSESSAQGSCGGVVQKRLPSCKHLRSVMPCGPVNGCS